MVSPSPKKGGTAGGQAKPREGRPFPPFTISPSPEMQLAEAQANLAAKQKARLDLEIKNLTARYGGDEALARRIAQDRAARNFAASDPGFAGEIAPIQQRITELEEQIKKRAQRISGQTIGGGNDETLGSS